MLPELQHRPCPVCGSTAEAGVYTEQRLDASRLNDFTYSSRKNPEHMTLRLVFCADCGVAYAPLAPDPGWLEQAYGSAAFDTQEEARFAADSYRTAIEPYTADGHLFGRGAIEVGAGTGAFLPHLQELGFSPVTGVEPSAAAIAAADPSVRSMIEHAPFDAADFGSETFGIFCSFQTLEHVAHPKALVEGAFKLLCGGGLIALVAHDHTAWLNRMLGKRSPIIDIEHLQLFHPRSLHTLLANAGFEKICVEPLRNRYPARYWMRLLPLPETAKRTLISSADAMGLGKLSIAARVGNLLIVGWKPEKGD